MKFIQSLAISLLTFFLPIQGILIAVGGAILLDTCTGIYKAKKLKQPIISKRLRNVAAKMAIYEAAVILFYVIDHHLLAEFFKIWFSVEYFFTKIIAMVLIFIEIVSIKENIEAAHGINILKLMRSAINGSKELKDGFKDLTN